MKKLYNNLINLTTVNKNFFFKDFELDDKIYRIFNYRIASFSDFNNPGAIESRGIMFEVSKSGEYINIKSRPMIKFWNLFENPHTIDLDLSKVVRVMDKADGSLISSYSHNNEIKLKSKGSLNSAQAIDAMEYLYHTDQSDLLSMIESFDALNYTINLEWCSPDNRIVLSYDTPHLQILNIRHNYTGEYLNIPKNITIDKYKVKEIKVNNPIEFIASIPDMKTKIEGFVCEMENGQLFKVKTLSYLALHHTKDSINCSRRLYEAVLEETTDDMRGLFYDDPHALSLIEDMETFVETKMIELIDTVEFTYNENKYLDRKEYAITCKSTLSNLQFPLAMNLYLDKPVNYKDFMKSKWKEFGLVDNK